MYVQQILFSKWNTYITFKKHPFTLCLLLPWKRDTPIVSRLLDTDMHPARSLAYKSICITFAESHVWQTQLDPCSLEVIVLFNFLFHFYRRAISESIACFRLATRVNFTFNRRVWLLLLATEDQYWIIDFRKAKGDKKIVQRLQEVRLKAFYSSFIINFGE